MPSLSGASTTSRTAFSFGRSPGKSRAHQEKEGHLRSDIRNRKEGQLERMGATSHRERSHEIISFATGRSTIRTRLILVLLKPTDPPDSTSPKTDVESPGGHQLQSTWTQEPKVELVASGEGSGVPVRKGGSTDAGVSLSSIPPINASKCVLGPRFHLEERSLRGSRRVGDGVLTIKHASRSRSQLRQLR